MKDNSVSYSNHLIGFTSLFLSILLFVVYQPSSSMINISVTGTLLVLVYLHVNKKLELNFQLLETIAGLLFILGCTLESVEAIPDRQLMGIVMACATSYIFCRQIKLKNHTAAWLLLTLGMTTAPYTELFQMRNLWNIGSLLIGLFHTIRLNTFFTRVSKRSHIAIFLWLILGLYTLCSSLWSVYPYATIRFAGTLFFLGLLLIQLVCVMSRPEMRRDVINALLVFVSVYLLAVVEAVSIRALGLGLIDSLGFRLNVFHHHPNYTIFMTLLTLPFWFTLLKKSELQQNILAFSGLIGCLIYLIFLSYSRQGYLLICIYAFLLIYLTHEQSLRKLFAWLIGICSVLITTSILLSASLQNRLFSIFRVSESMRFNAWKVFADLIYEQPIWGYGLGTNRYIYPRALALVRPGVPATRQFLFEAHNAYIDITTGLGLAGLILFCGFLVCCTIPTTHPRNLEQRIACTVGFGIWFDLFFNFRLHALDTSAFLMVLLAFCLTIQSSNSKITRLKPVSPILRTAIVTLVMIFCSIPWLGKHEVSLAQKQLRKGNWDLVYKHFSRASMLEPLNAHPHYYLALYYQQMNNPEEVMKQHTTAVSLCPNYPFYRFFLATEQINTHKPHEAMKQLEAGFYLEPYDPDGRTLFNLAILEQRFGHYKQAERDFMNTILLNPDYINDPYWESQPKIKEKLLVNLETYFSAFMSKYYLTQYRTTKLINTMETLIKAGKTHNIERTALGVAWDNPENIDLVCWTVMHLLEKGKPKAAENLLYHSLAVNPDNSVLLNYLGYIYLSLDDLQMAKYCVMKGFSSWSEIALDNYFGYQLLYEIAKKTKDSEAVVELEKKLKFLGSKEYGNQVSALTIHIGKDSYLVKAPTLSGLASSDKTP